jgi:hypothetical protein
MEIIHFQSHVYINVHGRVVLPSIVLDFYLVLAATDENSSITRSLRSKGYLLKYVNQRTNRLHTIDSTWSRFPRAEAIQPFNNIEWTMPTAPEQQKPRAREGAGAPRCVT